MRCGHKPFIQLLYMVPEQELQESHRNPQTPEPFGCAGITNGQIQARAFVKTGIRKLTTCF